jgi:hypothetical protein
LGRKIDAVRQNGGLHDVQKLFLFGHDRILA